jgi:hypothetical protein
MFGWPVNCWKKTRPTPIKSLKYKSLKFVEIKNQLSLQFYEFVNFLLGCLILTVISKRFNNKGNDVTCGQYAF